MNKEKETQILDEILEKIVGGGTPKKTIYRVLGILVPVLAVTTTVVGLAIYNKDKIIALFNKTRQQQSANLPVATTTAQTVTQQPAAQAPVPSPAASTTQPVPAPVNTDAAAVPAPTTVVPVATSSIQITTREYFLNHARTCRSYADSAHDNPEIVSLITPYVQQVLNDFKVEYGANIPNPVFISQSAIKLLHESTNDKSEIHNKIRSRLNQFGADGRILFYVTNAVTIQQCYKQGIVERPQE